MKLSSLKERARALKLHTLTVYFLARDPRAPCWLRLLAISIAAYALSPIDLIPDFIPVIGYLDDIVIVAFGIALVIRLAPALLLESAKWQASQSEQKPVSYYAAGFIIAVWIIAIGLAAQWLLF